MKKVFMCMALVGALAASAQAGFVTPGYGLSVSQGETGDLAYPVTTGDLISGMIATELPGDLGWHPANTAPADQLPAFTDDVLNSGLAGLLNDNNPGVPVKRIQYDLSGATDIGKIKVYSGNDGRDGRVFHTYTVEFSTDNGSNWSTPIYVQSHDSNTINNSGNNQWRVVLSELTNPSGKLATAATNVRFDFYSVDNTQGQMRDPFDGVNPFTGFDDTLTAAFVSPLVWEIDVLVPEPGTMALLAFGGVALLRRRR